VKALLGSWVGPDFFGGVGNKYFSELEGEEDYPVFLLCVLLLLLLHLV